MLVGHRTVPVAGSLVPLDHEELHRVRLEHDLQICAFGACGYQLHQHGGIEKLDPVIAPEILALVVPIIGVGLWIALFGVDDAWTLPFSELAVGHDIHALIANQPDTRLLITTGIEAVVGIAKAAVEGKRRSVRAS